MEGQGIHKYYKYPFSMCLNHGFTEIKKIFFFIVEVETP